MMIGVDFDNTIACYDIIFHTIAVEKGLIPVETVRTKEAVRDHLRAIGREDDWTKLQGYVYGSRMKEVAPFPGVIDFFRRAMEKKAAVCIISHKTRQPYLGPKYDLHKAAREWLEFQGFFTKGVIGLDRGMVFFEETKYQKLERIGQMKCSHFIDDLPEFLLEKTFPDGIVKLLFAPARPLGQPLEEGVDGIYHSWDDLSASLIR